MSALACIEPLVSTTTATVDEGLISNSAIDSDAGAWQPVVEELRDWPAHFADWREDGLEPPSPRILECGVQLARSLGQSKMPPPTKVLPDGEGGIVLENKRGDSFTRITLTANYDLELQSFTHGKLQWSRSGAVGDVL